jgi:hypothetical protein
MKEIYFSLFNDKKNIKNIYFVDEKNITVVSFYTNLKIDIINKKDMSHITYDKNITINNKMFSKIKNYFLINEKISIFHIEKFSNFLKKFNLQEWLI